MTVCNIADILVYDSVFLVIAGIFGNVKCFIERAVWLRRKLVFKFLVNYSVENTHLSICIHYAICRKLCAAKITELILAMLI